MRIQLDYGPESVVTLACDRQGIDYLIEVLNRIRDGGHDHLMAPSWGGRELEDGVAAEGQTRVLQLDVGVMMSVNEDPLIILQEHAALHRATPLPRVGSRIPELLNADVDLFEEDAYLAGLVDRALARLPLGVDEVLIDLSIDERIADAARAVPADLALQAMRLYRSSMNRLAYEVSAATGIPVRER